MGVKGKTKMSPTGKFKRSRASGFTLIEVSVVLFILAIFFGLFSLRLEGMFSGGDLRLASRILIGEITRLRGIAAYTHTEQELRFDISQNQFYTIDTLPGVENNKVGVFLEEGNDNRKTIKLPDGVNLEDVVVLTLGKFQGGEGGIRFYANGSVERSLIHLRNENNDVYTLEITPSTGHVIIHEKYIEQRLEK